MGRALGHAEQAETVVAAVEADIADARARHPEFAGSTAAIADGGEAGTFYVYGPARQEARFVSALGFTVPEFSNGYDPETGELSPERLDLLDTDVLLWYASDSAEPAHIAGNRLYQGLDVAEEGAGEPGYLTGQRSADYSDRIL